MALGVGLYRARLLCDEMYLELLGENRRGTVDAMLTKPQRRFMRQMKDFPSVLRTEYALALLQDGVIRDEDTGAVLDGDTVVSMNFWGFAPSVFDALETYFHDFLHSEAGQSVKAECLLPTMVGDLLAAGELRVSVLKSADRWFGMTYHEDVAAVKDSFKKMLENGLYKADLFSDL